MSEFLPLYNPPQCLYDYEVTGSDKSSGIDTQVDDGGNGALALPTNFRVLEMWIYARSDEALLASPLNLIFNNDTGGNYDLVRVLNANTTVTGSNGLAGTQFQRNIPGATAAANVFSPWQIAIHNYGGTVGHKYGSMKVGFLETAAANTIYFDAIIGYRSTTPISRVKIIPNTAGVKIKVGTRLTIFGR